MKESNQNDERVAASGVDWEKIHRRLEVAETAFQHGSMHTDAEKKEILKKRAKELAGGTLDSDKQVDSVEVVEFLLSQERYGIETSYVHEVCRLREVTSLPGTPSFVYGIMNLRGRIVSVLDARKFFDLPERGLTELNRVAVLRGEGMEFGILVDALLGIRKIAKEELQISLPTLTGIREEFLVGVSRDRTVVLDGRKLLTSKSIVTEISTNG